MAVLKRKGALWKECLPEVRFLSWEKYFQGAACGILYLSIQLFCNTLEFIKKERIF